LIGLWAINRHRDGVELLKDFMDAHPEQLEDHDAIALTCRNRPCVRCQPRNVRPSK
jgi:hypothetical protein